MERRYWPAHVVWTFLSGYLLIVFALGTLLYVGHTYVPIIQDAPSVWVITVTYLLQVLLTVGMYYGLKRLHKIPHFWHASGFQHIGWKNTIILPMLVYVTIILVLSSIALLADLSGVHIPGMSGNLINPPELFGNDTTGFILSLILITSIAPIIEEIGFRGILLQGMLQSVHPGVAIVASAVLFAALHLQPGAILLLTAQGIGMGWLFWRTQSIYPGIFYHCWNNLIVTLLLYFVVPTL